MFRPYSRQRPVIQKVVRGLVVVSIRVSKTGGRAMTIKACVNSCAARPRVSLPAVRGWRRGFAPLRAVSALAKCDLHVLDLVDHFAVSLDDTIGNTHG